MRGLVVDLFWLVVIGATWLLANRLIPMDAKFKMVLNVVGGLILLWWVLHLFGFMPSPVAVR
jgi:hypothetical protein